MPEAERRRFVRHLQAHWDIHRHRLPPQLAERIENLRRSGKLQVHAGRIQKVIAVGCAACTSSGAHAAAAQLRSLSWIMVVNATGPELTTSSIQPTRW